MINIKLKINELAFSNTIKYIKRYLNVIVDY